MSVPVEWLGLALIAAIVWFMWDSLKAREAALRACREACAAEQFLLLDETVAIQSLRLARGEEGQLRLRRVYGFEYTESGNSRRRGSIVLVGDRVIVLNLEFYDPLRHLPLH